MSRASRLLDLIQLLRAHRRPVTALALADTLGVSIRTLYRDIVTLQAQGADIRGEPGLGYVLKPGFLLPPIMFSQAEIEALVLGSRWVSRRTDDTLGIAARSALVKIAAVLPADLRQELEDSTLLVGQPVAQAESGGGIDTATVRDAIRQGIKVDIGYRDEQGVSSTRRIWPFALGYFETVRVVVAWCEWRADFRHFRVDRIVSFELTAERAPRRRDRLLADWRKKHGILPDL